MIFFHVVSDLIDLCGVMDGLFSCRFRCVSLVLLLVQFLIETLVP